MATPWPATLPGMPFNVQDDLGESVVRSQPDLGPPKVRRRTSLGVRRVTLPGLVLTNTQRETFRVFYETTLANGSLAFEWDHPTDDAETLDYLFEARPIWRMVRGGPDDARAWIGDVRLVVVVTP